MKSRFLIYFLVSILVILGIWLWWRPNRQSELTLTTKLTAQSSNSTANGNINVVTQSIPPTLNATNEVHSNQAAYSKLEEFVQTYNKYHNIPIKFYGKIVDQNSNPVVEAKIDVSVRQQYAVSAIERSSISKEIPKETMSGQDGHFVIQGEKGDSLHIDSIQKDGYLLSPKTEKTYEYVTSIEPFHSDSQNPVVIRVWKELPVKEPLITGSHVFGIDLGKTYTLDLLQGKKYIGETVGDLRISITRPDQVKPGEKYPWSFSIEAIGGGLTEAATDDEFMYLAPEVGYEPNFSLKIDLANTDWKPEMSKQFFISTRNGHVYGRVQATIYSSYNVHSAVEINYAINPNGSRNLQP